MARTILLTIKDNAAAEAFVKTVDEAQQDPSVWRPDDPIWGEIVRVLVADAKLDAVVARPTAACNCTGTQKKRGRIKPLGDYTRTPHFGWWVHAGCRKPDRLIVRRFIRNMLGGYTNLLPELRGGEAEYTHLTQDTLEAIGPFK
jgi:hypothetical protein